MFQFFLTSILFEDFQILNFSFLVSNFLFLNNFNFLNYTPFWLIFQHFLILIFVLFLNKFQFFEYLYSFIFKVFVIVACFFFSFLNIFPNWKFKLPNFFEISELMANQLLPNPVPHFTPFLILSILVCNTILMELFRKYFESFVNDLVH